MSRFAADFAEAMFPQLLEEHGETVTYTPAGGVGASKTAIVQEEADREEEGQDGLVVVRSITVKLGVVDLAASPRRGDALTWDGVVWGFARGLAKKNGYYLAAFENSAPVNKTRAGRNLGR